MSLSRLADLEGRIADLEESHERLMGVLELQRTMLNQLIQMAELQHKATVGLKDRIFQ